MIIEIDIERAREIRKAQLREQRAPILRELDVRYQRALEDDDSATQLSVTEYKRALRAITDDSRFESAQTLADLTAIRLPVQT